MYDSYTLPSPCPSSSFSSSSAFCWSSSLSFGYICLCVRLWSTESSAGNRSCSLEYPRTEIVPALTLFRWYLHLDLLADLDIWILGSRNKRLSSSWIAVATDSLLMIDQAQLLNPIHSLLVPYIHVICNFKIFKAQIRKKSGHKLT